MTSTVSLPGRSGVAKKSLVTLAIGSLLALGAQLASAQTLVFDRGLPTANINSTDANRSNVAWADLEDASAPSNFWLPGDDFTISGSGPFMVQKIRVWSTDNSGLSLWGGPAGGTVTQQSSTYAVTPVTYSNGQGYVGNSGLPRQLYQIDFAVNIPMNAGQKYQFFLEGPADANPSANGGGFTNAYLHASNKALSGSTQEGADDTFLWLDPAGNVTTWQSGTGGGTSGFDQGWDKNSDANVQVFASTNEKDCNDTLNDQKKEFDDQQKAEKKMFEASHPSKDDRKAFDDRQKADQKAFDQQQRTAKDECKALPKK